MPHMRGNDDLLDRLSLLIRGLHILEIPVATTQQYTRGLGSTVAEIRDLLDEAATFEKICFSCCDEPSFVDYLAGCGRKRVIIAGIESHVCVLQTAIDLNEGGNYTPVVVVDCVSSRRLSDKDASLDRMRGEGIRVTSSEAILFELCRRAGSAQFKQISQLVR